MKNLAAFLILVLLATSCRSQPVLAPNPISVQRSERAVSAIAVLAIPGPPVTLNWPKSSSTNVTSYKIYWGGISGSYTNSMSVGTNLTATVTNLILGLKYFFAATAFGTSGLESDFSSEAAWTVTPVGNVIELVVLGQYASSPIGPYTNYPTPIYRGPPTNMQFFRTVASLVTNSP